MQNKNLSRKFDIYISQLWSKLDNDIETPFPNYFWKTTSFSFITAHKQSSSPNCLQLDWDSDIYHNFYIFLVSTQYVKSEEEVLISGTLDVFNCIPPRDKDNFMARKQLWQ